MLELVLKGKEGASANEFRVINKVNACLPVGNIGAKNGDPQVGRDQSCYPRQLYRAWSGLW